jgi:hypothetical protein
VSFYPKARVHAVEEFGSAPWGDLDPELGREWSISRGGYGLGDGTWAVKFIRADGSTDLYPLPAPLSAAITGIREGAAADATRNLQAEFRALLGIYL